MNVIKHFILLIVPALAIFSACSGQEGHALKGTIQNAGNLQVMLEQAHFDRSTVAMGKATADAEGNFKIEQKEPFPEGLYRLSIGAKKMYFMLDGQEKTVSIKGDLNTIDRLEVQVEGSETFSCYANIVNGLFKEPIRDPQAAQAVLERSCNPLMRAFLTTQLLGANAGPFLAQFKKAGDELAADMPGSKYATDYTAMIAQVEQQMAQQSAGGGGELIQVGQPAPNISLPGPDGKVRSLASLKGKIVLLDFWASWCGPCRRENPRVVEVYKKYKDKGFDIFSVSLDGADPRRGGAPDQLKKMESDGKQKWMAAIKQDGLVWDNHVSDLKHWGSAPAATYGVTSIPKTFLVGRDGKIIAINPRQNLEQELLKAL
jgi:thiol-disulfide isomerase/thioredoxin